MFVAVALVIALGIAGIDGSSAEGDGSQSATQLLRSIRAAEEAHFEATGDYTDSISDLATRPGGGSILGIYGDPSVDVEIDTGHGARSVLAKVTAGEGSDRASGWFMLLGKREYGSGGYGSPLPRSR